MVHYENSYGYLKVKPMRIPAYIRVLTPQNTRVVYSNQKKPQLFNPSKLHVKYNERNKGIPLSP